MQKLNKNKKISISVISGMIIILLAFFGVSQIKENHRKNAVVLAKNEVINKDNINLLKNSKVITTEEFKQYNDLTNNINDDMNKKLADNTLIELKKENSEFNKKLISYLMKVNNDLNSKLAKLKVSSDTERKTKSTIESKIKKINLKEDNTFITNLDILKNVNTIIKEKNSLEKIINDRLLKEKEKNANSNTNYNSYTNNNNSNYTYTNYSYSNRNKGNSKENKNSGPVTWVDDPNWCSSGNNPNCSGGGIITGGLLPY